MPKKSQSSPAPVAPPVPALTLHEAASEGNLGYIEQHVREQQRMHHDLQLLNAERNTPLHTAASKGHTDVIEIVNFLEIPEIPKIPEIPEIPDKLPEDVMFPVVHPFLMKNVPTLSALAKNNKQQTCLHIAAEHGHLETLKAVLVIQDKREYETQSSGGGEERQLIGQRDQYGHTVLHVAILKKHTDVAEWLIAKTVS
ncbi:PREDICTED: receptor-interacting serine/threonine-protein kinase 4-like [Priapulus caudatus]|uniref:Receptor-interacting serine/threonine-protein kinase 4-like n=1 Tax=Priapulus caudatus TaxID=37621 RepID=A0ABM1F053_PRICU|nr:PREDICTED: receptor-interacting serine/threonine-protein kinase 4-like [Priapulus caudatus]